MKQPKAKYAHYGLYMVVMSLLVLAIVVLANGIAHRLPVSWTQFDTSASRLYSLSPQTEEIAAGLTEDVTLYLVIIEALLVSSILFVVSYEII